MQDAIWDMVAGHGKVYLDPDALARFASTLSQAQAKVMVLTDHNTARHCLPVLAATLPPHHHLSLPAGEPTKSLAACGQIWEALTQAQFERGDWLLNLGGGMVCDLGGFAASCYKRGMRFAHLPTSLLAMADAAVGGKTGINFLGFKNHIGTFQQPQAVVIHTPFLDSLPPRECRAGYAEVLKHYLIHDRPAWEAAARLRQIPTDWTAVVPAAVRIKLHFTEADPLETGIRKALNFGHTVGHAVESHGWETRPEAALLHGEAIAVGMACEAWLSWQRGLILEQDYRAVSSTLHALFGHVAFAASEVGPISTWCLQDKKNVGGKVGCTLLQGLGGYATDQWVTLAEVEAALQAYLHTSPLPWP